MNHEQAVEEGLRDRAVTHIPGERGAVTIYERSASGRLLGYAVGMRISEWVVAAGDRYALAYCDSATATLMPWAEAQRVARCFAGAARTESVEASR